ncbi:M16 family metallopeptidase [Croceiramulus getboli]|nr:pitrilysin family protein [Flavobacteriaceae bacterium YJPT1-3]
MNYRLIWCCLALGLLLGCNKEESATPTDTFTLDYEKFTLDNGLEVILHVDRSDPIVAVATVMHVGSNREKPGKTGFAHFFEHMSFNDSENVPVGANRKMIPEWGGSRNGGTWSDGTIYYEVVPKDAFEKILWIDSDRFGYMINTVTEEALEREKQVVKNEKRQRVDNAPYGYTDEIIRKNLYPEGHPYSWTVIGSLPDLQSATLEDVKEFYNQYYGAGNASLVIAGDIDIEETKRLVQQWFGEIPKGPEVAPLNPQPVVLDESKSLYFEDNFAKLPELRQVYPTIPAYHEDEVPLGILGQLLSGSRKAPLYQVIVEEQKLAPNVSTYNNSSELAGEFVFRVRANAGTSLDSVNQAIQKGLDRFEKNGFTDDELKRIKTEAETNLYYGVETVLNKAFQLVQDNEFGGDPAYITERAAKTQAVTREDIMRVYNTYIKDQQHVMLSTVPKEQADLAVTGAQQAEVWQEEVTAMKANEQVAQGEEAEYEKTPTAFDRSEPDFGEAPLFNSPDIWEATLDNRMHAYGIESNELPLVVFRITIDGGQLLEDLEKAGVSSLTASMMNQGTKNRTPAELEEAIGLLGASINFNAGKEELVISGSCLARNYKETMALVQEMLLEPRWDEAEFERLTKALETNLKGREANPRAIASLNFDQLIYGKDNIYGIATNDTLETTKNITLNDLKAYYQQLNPEDAVLHIVGDLNQEEALAGAAPLVASWKGDAVPLPEYALENQGHAGKLYFIDVPGSKQSVLYIGKPALSATDPKADELDFANEILGGGSSGRLFQVLRIGKGYTYGAYSYIPERLAVAPFTIQSSVRANATFPSLEIIEDMVESYGPDFTQEDVALTQNKILKQNTRAYESLNAKLGMLRDISKFKKPKDFVEQEQQRLMEMTLDDFKAVIENYLQEDEMVYVVVGDKATQWEEVKKLGKPVIELDIYGAPVE